MFLELLSFLSSLDTGFNVLSYLTVRAVFAMMTALLITLLLGKWIIGKLQDYQIGQVIRDDGPERHSYDGWRPDFLCFFCQRINLG
jgi:phospho-N-acetylmuramoyl-pentapeptide-transferase